MSARHGARGDGRQARYPQDPPPEGQEAAEATDKTRRYKVEIWDPGNGKELRTLSHYASAVRGEPLTFRLPPFCGDVALKVRPLE